MISSGGTASCGSAEEVILFRLDLKFRTVTWKIIEKAHVHHFHASSECLPVIFAFGSDSLIVIFSFGKDLDVFLLVTIMEWQTSIFDGIAFLEVFFYGDAFFEVIVTTDVVTARFKVKASCLSTILMTVPLKCLNAFLRSS